MPSNTTTILINIQKSFPKSFSQKQISIILKHCLKDFQLKSIWMNRRIVDKFPKKIIFNKVFIQWIIHLRKKFWILRLTQKQFWNAFENEIYYKNCVLFVSICCVVWNREEPTLDTGFGIEWGMYWRELSQIFGQRFKKSVQMFWTVEIYHCFWRLHGCQLMLCCTEISELYISSDYIQLWLRIDG